jgi:pilus assembly protein TadC
MLPIMASEANEESRWADAQSLLDRAPTESAGQRLQRWRRLRVLLLASALLVSAAVGVVLFVLFSGPPAHTEEAPTWQAVVGFVIAAAGLVLQGFGVAALWWVNRRVRGWRSPLSVLTRAQRKELLAQVRAQRPVEPSRVPMARLLAEQLVGQRALMASNLGLGICYVGLWIASPALWRAVIAGLYGLLLVLGWPFIERDARRALRFLDAHPHSTEWDAA